MAIRNALGQFSSLSFNPSIDEDTWTWSAVSSSNVAAVGYNEGTSTLGVTFLNGSTYYYSAVPITIYESLLLAPSVGSFLHHNVKGAYAYERVS